MRRPLYSLANSSRYFQSNLNRHSKVLLRTCNQFTESNAQTLDTTLSDCQYRDNSYQRRSSYELAAEYENQLDNNSEVMQSSCRVHGNRNINPSPLSTEELLYISERDNASQQLQSQCNLLSLTRNQNSQTDLNPTRRIHFCPEFLKAMENVHYIADCTRRTEEENEVKEDWKYVAMVLDRLFLWIFTTAVLVGTCGIILHAPTLYDNRQPIDVKLSEVALAVLSQRKLG